jgi:hypothetical protein
MAAVAPGSVQRVGLVGNAGIEERRLDGGPMDLSVPSLIAAAANLGCRQRL